MIALMILMLAGAFASGYLSRCIVARAGSLPPASRRAIRRDRRRSRLGLADVPAPWRSPLHVATVRDPLEARLTDAIGKLGGPPPRGWQAGVWARIRKERPRG